MMSDLEIAQRSTMKPISEIANTISLNDDDYELYGKYKAKISLDVLNKFQNQPLGKYIDVTAITPTPLGEGKTVTTIGLAMGLNAIGKKSIVCIRQPSLGPVFGIKGGAAGGGYSQVIPMEDFNLHLTGDTHAVSLAHNLLAAFIDNHLHHGNALDLNPYTISWPRVVDVSDRSLRKIILGLGGKENGVPRESGFDISVASEVMAILALTTDLSDIRKRLGRIVIGYNKKKQPITAEDLKCAGSMAVLMKDAIKPNLLQTLENTPCLVHAGPFANIAHGNSSIIADQIALRLTDYVVTESGFGADCGMEKFMDIKCRYSGLKPNCVVMVCSIRALKMHSGKYKVVPGKPLDPGLAQEDIEAVTQGSENLIKQIENARYFGIPVVVAINAFTSDSPKEIETVRKISIENGAFDAVVSEVWAKGGDGGKDLAQAVARACDNGGNFQFLYPLDIPIKDKIHAIATKIYGADGVVYENEAEKKIKLFTEMGWDTLPICMAKTHLSLSHDPKLLGRPRGYKLPIRDIRPSIGAGFLYPLCGEMRTMPGLPSKPAGNTVDFDEDGNVVGLF
ncbi:MAG: formate--tetrahydrofolate ligase [Atribacter sp.]|jgi:formyltetrahydrofolate synthetase|uniref:Formate--tetrahydrofolate ligase n=1 Tax=Candidatus Atribacter allofermentans TaxID=1852833 RepID=A0A1V5SWN3_9BACT|nr:MAG: Formate--tetrahydrofolate ligase [Candidatus Atribacteria bacterium ADurb.Bin276]HHT08946.1 formate--tetrahydrofolate ligase [Candidatus Atribacteria bacterium]HOT05621.1 formate--tetrahydrofolate ligase [Atribacter sp.]